MIIQNIAHDEGSTDVTFTVPQSDLMKSIDVLEKAKSTIGFERFTSDDNVVKISVVGAGTRSHAGVAYTMFEVLGSRGHHILAISTSDLQVLMVIATTSNDIAICVLHTAYGLGDIDTPATAIH